VNSKSSPRMAFRNSSTSEAKYLWRQRRRIITSIHGNMNFASQHTRPATMPARFCAPCALSLKESLRTMPTSWRASKSKDKAAHQISPIFDSVFRVASGADIPRRAKSKLQINVCRAE
jgi:hypothetical protein